MGDRVEPRGAATSIGCGHLVQAKTGDRAEDGARCLTDALRVREVASVLQRHVAVEGAEAPFEVLRGNEFKHILHGCAELLGSLRPLDVVPQQLTVFLHRRATAGSVDDHRIDAGLREGVDVAPRLKTLKVTEPPKRSAGIKVADAAELVGKLREEGVI